MRLKYQLFLTLLVASALLIALMYGINRYSFSRSFLDYVNQNEIERLSPVAEQLVADYEQNGDWRAARPILRPPPPGRGDKPRRRRTPPLVLLDSNKEVLFGRPELRGNLQTIPLESHDQIVGYLGVHRKNRVDRQFDQEFKANRQKSFGLTALAMILLSALLSIPLASRIVRPLLTVNKAVGDISSGDYGHKVDIKRNDEIGDLANNINSLSVSLEQNRHARQRWIAEISHELRTPVAVLRGEIEAVQDGVRVLDANTMNSLHSEVSNLNRLIDDLHTLSVSDVGALDYKMQPINLPQYVDQFLTSRETELEDHSIRLENKVNTHNSAYKQKHYVMADTQRLDQLLGNLLQNTCRYTNAEGRLQVDMGINEFKESSMLVIDWLDSAPGIDPDDLSKLFSPLFRADASRSRELGGSGLGLSIVKRIVEAHQGTISASLSPIGGLHIQICLPTIARPV